MTTRKLPSFLTLSGPVLLLSSVALAQPNQNPAPIAQNPPNQIPGGGGRGNRGMGGFGGGFGGQMTTEQRQMQQRQSLIMAGVTDAASRDTVVAYLDQQETARQSLRAKWNTLLAAVRAEATTDTQLAALLNDFRGAVDEERARREKARAALDAKLDLPKKPRLDAQLMISGLLGDEAALVMGENQGGGRGGRGGFGGPGGFGGGFGGGF